VKLKNLKLKYTSLTKIIIKEENFKWHLEAFASELFIYSIQSCWLFAHPDFAELDALLGQHILLILEQNKSCP